MSVRNTVLRASAAMLLVLGPVAAAAEPVSGAAAKKMLYPADGAEVRVIPRDFMGPSDPQILKQVGATQKYYGAVAVSPAEGLASEATVAGANFHDVDSARASALKACNAKRATGTPPCQIVAEILPRGWKQGALQLSADATAAFADTYAAQDAPKALAISPATGEWAIGVGQDAGQLALLGCRERAKGRVKDAGPCALSVQD